MKNKDKYFKRGNMSQAKNARMILPRLALMACAFAGLIANIASCIAISKATNANQMFWAVVIALCAIFWVLFAIFIAQYTKLSILAEKLPRTQTSCNCDN